VIHKIVKKIVLYVVHERHKEEDATRARHLRGRGSLVGDGQDQLVRDGSNLGNELGSSNVLILCSFLILAH
jgi:hypothetical protein